VSADGGVGVLIASSFVYSLGSAPIFTLTNDLILGTAPPERAGAASAISETGAELGGALSIAILGTIGTAVYRMQVDDGIPAGVPPEEAETARDTLGGAVAASGDLNPGLAEQVLETARVAFTQGLQVVALLSAILAALTAVGVAIFLRRVRATPPDAPSADAVPAAVAASEPE
jgi:DHA2 family multidrug resistance protein-like MFS transporter